MAGSLFRTKSIDRLMAEHAGRRNHAEADAGRARPLVALGIGAIIGAGLFVAHRRGDRRARRARR